MIKEDKNAKYCHEDVGDNPMSCAFPVLAGVGVVLGKGWDRRLISFSGMFVDIGCIS